MKKSSNAMQFNQIDGSLEDSAQDPQCDPHVQHQENLMQLRVLQRLDPSVKSFFPEVTCGFCAVYEITKREPQQIEGESAGGGSDAQS